jgi:hypothetical protein
MVVQRSVDWVLGREPSQDDVPICPDHDELMQLYKKVGKPARFSDQGSASYELLYRCPVPGCDNTATRRRVRNQIPVPGEVTPRPRWALRRNKSV